VKTELRRETSPLATLNVGQPMPDFTLTDREGKTIRLSEVTAANKVVLVNFWASWCAPCRIEMPGFEELYRDEKKNGFAILAIAEDKDRAKLDAYLKGKPVSFPVLLDTDGKLGEKLKIESLPTNVLIDPDGKVKQVHEGVERYLVGTVRAMLKPAKTP
jgi:peroxiredoxin